MSPTRFTFHAFTPRYLGSPSFGERLRSLAASLPPSVRPTRYQSSRLQVKPAIDVTTVGALHAAFPGNAPYDGDVSLYRPRGNIDISVLWFRGSRTWFEGSPTKPFNVASINVSDIDGTFISTPLFETLYEAWIGLLHAGEAAYGYAFISDPAHPERPRGQGRCLPRLHWKTYLGSHYCAELAVRDARGIVSAAEVLSGQMLTLPHSAEFHVKPTDVEKQAIKALGEEYFWREGDSWRDPRGRYLLPSLDWSDLVDSDAQ